MTDRELMQQALEALLWEYGWGDPKKPQLAAITALRERLAQPEMNQWQGLTDEEINSVCYKRDWTAPWTDLVFARAIEAKLKERNG